MAATTLSTGHSLYPNVVRGLTRDPAAPRLVDSIPAGSSNLAVQTTPSIACRVANGNVTAIQCIMRDDSHWYEIDTTEIRRSDITTGNVTTTNSSPFTGLTAGIDHLGGGDLDSGLLYLPAVDWNSGNQTSASQTVAIYAAGNLALDSSLDVSGSSACNFSAVCIGHTGNLFCTSFFTGAGPDDRLVDIYEIDITDGSEVAVHTADGNLTGAQGIAYDSDGEIYIVTCFVGDNEIVTLDTSFNVLYRFNPTLIGSSDEIEGVFKYADRTFYTHELNGNPLQFDPGGMYIHPTLGDTPGFLPQADIPDSGTIVIRGTPASIFNFNALWDNTNSANDWECWIYSDGRFAGRIPSATIASSASGLVTAGTEAIFGFGWERSGSTVTYDIVHNGSIKQTQSGAAWVTPPAAGLSLGGANASNTQADFQYRDVIVYNKRLSSSDWSALAADFDAVYTAAPANLLAIMAAHGLSVGA